MPKPKQFLKESKKKSKHAPSSTRFFVRAIDCYDEALKKFPHSFDLAYNKARLQYEITQYPKLLQQLPGSLLELLQTAIESSKYALKLNEQNADVLFNTAQALTSYVEALQDASNATDPLPFLEESLELFQKCLDYQELQHREFQEQSAAAFAAQETDMDDGGVSLTAGSSMDVDSGPATPSTNRDIPLDTPSSPPAQLEDDRWATIVEPVTDSSLLDTILAQLRTLSLLCTLLPVPSGICPSSPNSTPLTPPGQALQSIQTYASSILPKLTTYTATTSRTTESQIAHSDYLSSLTDLQYRNGLLTPSSYFSALSTLYTHPTLQTNPEALVKAAESLITFHQNITFLSPTPTNPTPNPEIAALSWQALSTALSNLTSASKLPDVENLAAVHVLRGDVEMLRYQMGQLGFEVSRKNEGALLRNAEVFYRGGKNVARADGDGEREKVEIEGRVKEGVVRGLRGESVEGLEGVGGEGERVVREAVEDGVFTWGQVEGLGVRF
ncbi:hypothetical protein L207DRAFT_534731 [Hyaloscypha variabilis F]|uniref:Uncharacterized protein n=1 Tax=Hyaloscypha variabilis (strain UAMH 11265 / GT02V1 / F) TaxID=1149755 RepID=A0A2J6R7C4_HYAVF|nr:hypothetical protein L207DRAFT_534731 [Hyaloscypha variabilis F]